MLHSGQPFLALVRYCNDTYHENVDQRPLHAPRLNSTDSLLNYAPPNGKRPAR